MKPVATAVAIAAGLLGACSPPGTPVTLNERIFELPSMKSLGKGCTNYELRAEGLLGEGGPSSGGGTGGGGLVISQRSADDRVVVEVTDGSQVVVHRSYGEAFFRSGALDQFIARGASGEARLLRYWGSAAGDGRGGPRCAAFDDDSPR